MKKTSIPNPVKSLRYIKCYSSNCSSGTVKSSSNSIWYNCQTIQSWSRRPKTILEIRKKIPFLYVINNPIILQVFQRNYQSFTNDRKKTNMAVIFRCRPFPNILKCRDHRWHLPAICKTRLLHVHIEEFS